jgi:hypothetical protein
MSTLAVNSVTDANGGNTATINSMTPTADSLQGFRNRIINGDMRIDQRNAGAAVTVNSTGVAYPVDRNGFSGIGSAGVFTAQQDSSAPSSFVNSVKVTVTTAAASYASTDNYLYEQRIEGTNVSDLAWGSASAKTVTLSFWVRSSQTGTFSGALSNSARDRSYPFNYSISVADTWEQKSVTIDGDTSGTWLTTTGVGIRVLLNLGAGTDRLGTAGAWNGNRNVGATGSVQLMDTLNATWYITGVQLEVGSVATPFERRPYGTELSLCQRYYYKVQATGASSFFGVGYNSSTTVANALTSFPVQMRVAPSALEQSGTASDYRIQQASPVTCSSVPIINTSDIWAVTTIFTVASGLTAGNAIMFRSANSNAFLAWSAEL